MNIEEYKKLLKKSESRSKYGNKKITFSGETFDSKKEYEYYLYLLDREKKGEISQLKRQYTYTIQPSFYMPDGSKISDISYKADFVYYDLIDSRIHIVDVKGFKTDVYKLKKKLLAYRGIYIEEV